MQVLSGAGNHVISSVSCVRTYANCGCLHTHRSLFITKKQELYQEADGSKGLTLPFLSKSMPTTTRLTGRASCLRRGPRPGRASSVKRKSQAHSDMVFSCLIWIGMKKFLPISQTLKSPANRISKQRGTSHRGLPPLAALFSQSTSQPPSGRRAAGGGSRASLSVP